MKKFETLTEIEILNAAWLYYLDLEQRVEERYRQFPNELTKRRYERYKASEEELHKELLRLENCIH